MRKDRCVKPGLVCGACFFEADIPNRFCARGMPAGIDKHSCNNAPKGSFDYMGYSVRTEDWRYTAWLDWDGEQ